MDPQGRLLLEQSGLALSSSEPGRLFSSAVQAVGVYVGVMHMEYIQFMSGQSSILEILHAKVYDKGLHERSAYSSTYRYDTEQK